MQTRNMKIWASLALLSVVAGCGGNAGGPAPANIPALSVVPDNALAVVLIKDLSQIDAKFSKLAQLTGAPIPLPIGMAKAMLGIQKGLDDKGAAVIAVMNGKSGPAPILCVPVTDYKQFIAQFTPTGESNGVTTVTLAGMPAFVAAAKNYAAFSPGLSKDTSDLQAFVAAKSNIAATLASVSGWMNEQDVAAVGTAAGVKLALGPVRQGLDKAKQSFPADDPKLKQVRDAFAIYDALLKTLDEDLENGGIGLRVDDAGNVHATSKWQFKTASPTAKLFTDVKALDGQPLADLPAGPYMMAGAGAMSQSMTDWMKPLIEASPQFAGLPPDQKKELNEAMAQAMKSYRSMSMTLGVPADGKPMFDNTTIAMGVEDGAKALADLEKSMGRLAEVYAKTPGMPKQEGRSVTVGGAKGLEMTIDMSGAIPNDNPQVREMLSALLGPEGKMTVTYAALDSKTLLAFYVNAEEAAKRVEAYKGRKGNLAGDPAVAKTLALLPKGSQFVGVLDLAGTMTTIKQIAVRFAPEGKMPDVPTVPACPPIGLAFRCAGGGLETDLVVPAETIKTVAAFAPTLKRSETKADDIPDIKIEKEPAQP